MHKILEQVEKETKTKGKTTIKSKSKNSKTNSIKNNTPLILIDDIMEWEHTPEHDDFWA